MQPEFWLRAWEEGRTGFHRDAVHDDLLAFRDRFLPGTAHRVLVPLCGKSHDLKWLADQGHEVVGVELSEIAITQFFDEQGLDATRSGNQWTSGRITLVQADIFEVNGIGTFDRLWDRAAIVALDPATRTAYVNQLRALLSADGRILLNAFTYDQSQMDGPPWSVPEDQIRSLWNDRQVEVLRRQDVGEMVKFPVDRWEVATYQIG